MSLLDRGEPFIAYPSTDGDGEFGAPKRIPGDPNGLGVSGKGQFTRPSADRVAATAGQDNVERVVLSTRSFPFGQGTVVRWQDRLWDVTEEPLVRNGSPRVQHVSVSLSARTGLTRG